MPSSRISWSRDRGDGGSWGGADCGRKITKDLTDEEGETAFSECSSAISLHSLINLSTSSSTISPG